MVSVLFEELMLPAGKKTKTGDSTNAEALQSLADQYPVVADILDAAKHFEYLKGWGWEDELPGEVLREEEEEDAWFVRAQNTRDEITAVCPDADIVFEEDGVCAFFLEKQSGRPFDKLNVCSAIRVLEV